MKNLSPSLLLLPLVLLASQTAVAADPSCQQLSDGYAIEAGLGFGFAPANIQTLWKQKACNTFSMGALQPSLCQELSDRFGILGNGNFGTADANAQGSWKWLGCGVTSPVKPTPSCQALSDTYGMGGAVGYGMAPVALQALWRERGCSTLPQPAVYGTLCHQLSNRFNLGLGNNTSPDLAATAAWKVLGCAALQAPAKNPVLIVGGTMAPELIYVILEGRLRGDGYTVEFFELPGQGKIDINESAKFLRDRIGSVLLRTGARKLHLIAHSQGGIVARTYIYRHNGAESVESLITLASPHKGTQFVTSNDPMATFLGCGQAANPKPLPCQQLSVGSALLKELGSQPFANDSIYYTTLVTKTDSFVVPFLNGQMDGCIRKNAAGVSLACNVTVQDQCPLRLVDHIGLASDGAVYSGIKSALLHQPIALNCLAL